MATIGDIHVRLRVDATEFTYAVQTTTAALTRMDRATWLRLPRWRRFWLTLQRKGW